MTDDIVTRIRQEWQIDKVSTHYNGCWLYHGECAVRLLVAEIDRLRAAGDALAEALATLGGDRSDIHRVIDAWEEARRG